MKNTLVHSELAAAKRRGASHEWLDHILDICPDMECGRCGEIMCPLADEMHFHHDGCPSCHGTDLERAITAVANAVDGRGLKVYLCNPTVVAAVKDTLRMMTSWFSAESKFLTTENEEASARNLALVATLYAEHLSVARLR